uniref:Germin-like protein n=1 Tax=Tamarix hispida TaxID=189793 RepID=A0A4P8F9P7_9CARY|nr:germin-like protein [Tamarix hispida]
MASPTTTYTLALLLCLATLWVMPLPSHCADPDPLQDFCVADMKATPPVSGFPCKPADMVAAADFISDALLRPGNTDNVFKSAVTQGNAVTFPGLNTLGIALNRVDFAVAGLNPPHSHPRATEAGFVLEGKFLIGFVTSNNTLFSNVVHPGQMFVFPRGLVHFQRNIGKGKGLILTAFNSQNAGVDIIPTTLFASNPPIPDFVLSQTFQINDKLVEEIRGGLANA